MYPPASESSTSSGGDEPSPPDGDTQELMSFEKFYQSNRNSFINPATQSEPIHSHSSDNLTYDAYCSRLPNTPTAHSNVYEYIRNIQDDDADAFLTSPYRTGSHLGFNSPRRNARPLHFHVATATSQYVPIPRALSIGEMFVNDQMLDCSDVEHLMHEKIQQQRSRFWLYPRGWQMPQLGFLDQIETVKKWLMPSKCDAEPTSEHVGDQSSDDGSAMVSSSDDEQNATLTVLADVHAAPDHNNRCLTPIPEDQDTSAVLPPTNDEAKTISRELIENILRTMELDKENIDLQPQKPVSSTNNTFVQKINEMNYSSVSPNFEFQKQRFEALTNDKNSVQRKHMREINNGTGSPRRQVMGREERYQRQEEFMDMWEDHVYNVVTLPAERPMTTTTTATGSECSDLSTFDPLEQKILTQIDANALDQYDGIFTKIKNSIIESNHSKLNGTFSPEEYHSSEMLFRSLNGSLTNSVENLSSQDTIIITPNTSFIQQQQEHFDDPVFVPNARNSSTPKTKAAATLNTRKSSSEWAQLSRSFEKNQSSPVTLNVSKTRTILPVTTNKSQDSLSTLRPKPKTPKHRNFIQENIEKAALKKARTISNKSNQKPSRHLSKSGTANTPRSNPGAIFAVSPFSKQPSNQFINKNCSSNVANCMSWTMDGPKTNGGTPSATTDSTELLEIQTKIDGLIAGMASPMLSPPDFGEESDRIMECVEQCGQRLTELHIDRVAQEVDEIIEMHEMTEQEIAAEKLRDDAELREKWVRYNELMFSLSEEDD